jgi:hypothetical protein
MRINIILAKLFEIVNLQYFFYENLIFTVIIYNIYYNIYNYKKKKKQ